MEEDNDFDGDFDAGFIDNGDGDGDIVPHLRQFIFRNDPDAVIVENNSGGGGDGEGGDDGEGNDGDDELEDVEHFDVNLPVQHLVSYFFIYLYKYI